MRDLFKKQTSLTRIEFWAISTIFVFVIFFLIRDAFEWDDTGFVDAGPYKSFFDQAKMPFKFFKNYFLPQLINHLCQYFYILCLNFVLIPRLIKQALLRDIFYLVLIFVFAGTVFGITGTYLKEYFYAGDHGSDQIDETLFLLGFENALVITWVLIIYTAIKYAGLYLFTISEKIEARYRFIRKEAIVMAAIWLVGLLVLRFGRAENEIFVGWAIVLPCAIALYLFSFYRLIPRSQARSKHQLFTYVRTCFFLILIAFFVIYLASTFITSKDDAGLGYSAFNAFFQLFITVPVTWSLYKRHLKGNEAIVTLQKELKQSTANIDFLRSQINPHFLFNALNTIYGTAIQEKAERTSEGIERLGDMMRFMLQENMQENISLVREIDYLKNYISLQRLRTDANPIIQIQTEIQDGENSFQIAPMLLIPFVENAFKHGISFREASHIKVTFEIKEDTLYFDVYNSKHVRQVSDPEKDKNGIGLENVKQRLKLLYPDRHQLVIHETSREFFIHLTIQLK